MDSYKSHQGKAFDLDTKPLSALPAAQPSHPPPTPSTPPIQHSLHQAASSLRLGLNSAAINGAVNLLIHPSTTAMLQKAGMLAADGRCKTLSPDADGYARSDAAGMALVTVPEAATGVSGRLVAVPLALIRGTAVNQDGRSSTLTAPNGPAQQEVMRGALRWALAAAAEVTALQMHGTGTPLGDPIEIGAAAAALVEGRAEGNPLLLQAAKSWTGHAEPAAGMVGLMHTHAALSARAALPIMHLGNVNAYVEGEMLCCGCGCGAKVRT